MKPVPAASCLSLRERWHGASRDGEGVSSAEPVTYQRFAPFQIVGAATCRPPVSVYSLEFTVMISLRESYCTAGNVIGLFDPLSHADA